MSDRKKRNIVKVRVYQALLRCLHRRGYQLEESLIRVATEPLPSRVFEHYGSDIKIIENALNSQYIHRQDPQNILVTFYTDEAKVADVIAPIETSQEPNTQVIWISRNAPASGEAKASILHAPRLEHFTEAQMMLDPLHHIFQASFMSLNNVEKINLFKNPTIKEGQLPGIHNNEAVTKFMGWKDGTVLKVIQKNLAAETLTQETLTYRMVNGPKPAEPKASSKQTGDDE